MTVSSATSSSPILPHQPASAVAPAGNSRVRRDFLLNVEKKIQHLWEEKKIYESDAPFKDKITQIDERNIDKKDEKFFCTFPYAYMNGCLHLGHAFSMTKVEFAARFQRMLDKNVLWPYAFHCTGMPIFASAVKLKREIEEMERAEKKDINEETIIEEDKSKEECEGCEDLAKFSSKKSKVVQKTGGVKSQWQIMETMGISEAEICKFAEPNYWLHFFPPLAVQHLKSFGAAIDWRRSFITTDVNPYYDAFIKWQFRLLKERNKVKFGMRSAVFSRVEHQPCADHDRASGEGVCPQEYTLIKLEVQELPQKWKEVIKGDNIFNNKKVYLTAATLRPETMYGQTNCYVLPEGKYGFYLAFENQLKEVPRESTEGVLEISLTREEAIKECTAIYVCSKRSALNMSFQGILPLEKLHDDKLCCISKWSLKEPHCLFELNGSDLIGVPLTAPYSIYPTVFALPMLTISMDKGTGVVTSVPSDSPDDYAALMDIKNKKDYFREKYGVLEEWVTPFEIVEIIDIPNLGSRCAVDLYNKYKISSQKDKQKLQDAKDESYKRGFFEGVLIVGSHKGTKVCDAKNIVRDELINKGFALSYFEPEKKVISRSGEECVVALCNQWYIDYGEENWKILVENHVNDPASFNAYSERALNQYQHVVQWLKGWACSRHYGLGTHLPWDEQVVIESLSDSTIYMAYYSIAHFLQSDMNGTKEGSLGIKAEQLTDDVFNYVFLQTDTLPQTDIPIEHLNLMRNEFSYWYPMDLRASGKDLIFNHLTMTLYNHAAIWSNQPQLWPRGFFCNGMVMVDAEKMSKSLGNFLTVDGAVKEFSADATRIALADAGDSLDDANFQRETANASIMKLYIFEQFVREIVNGQISLRTGVKDSYDEFFENEIVGLTDTTKDAYQRLIYRDALKAGFFDFQTRRDQYRNMCGEKEMHHDSIMLFIETQVKILSPIAPHICEHIWTNLLKKSSFVVTEKWPVFEMKYNSLMHRKYTLLLSTIEEFRSVRDKMIDNKSTRGGKHQQQRKPFPTHAIIYIAKEYIDWQQKVLQILQSIQLDENGNPPADFMNFVKNHPEFEAFDKNLKKLAFSFASFQMKEELKARGSSVLELRLPFDELELVSQYNEFICRSLGLKELSVLDSLSSHPADTTKNKCSASPGKPAYFFYTPE